jgi:hypothetical protein
MYLRKRSPDLLLRAVNRGNNSQCQGHDRDLGRTSLLNNVPGGDEPFWETRVVKDIHPLLTRKAKVIGQVVGKAGQGSTPELEAIEHVDHLPQPAVVPFIEFERYAGQVEELVVLALFRHRLNDLDSTVGDDVTKILV